MKLDLIIESADTVHVQIERFIRRQIQTGELGPGFRLPPTGDLARMWGVHRTAIQRALSPLVAQGLIERRRKRGTFVSTATQKAVIGILFGPSLADEPVHFFRALRQALAIEARQHEWSCRVYDGLNAATEPDRPGQQEMLHHLEQDIHNYGFKGLLHVSLRHEVSQKLERDCRLPTVRAAAVEYDGYQFARDSVSFLVQQGRRRLASVCTPMGECGGSPILDGFWDQARARGLTQAEVLAIPRTGPILNHEAQVQQHLERIIRERRARPLGMPDGLIVGDDIMMRGVALALLSTGVKVPAETFVVTLASDRVRMHYGVPVVRYEFSVGDLAKEVVGLLWKRMLREPLPPLPVVLRGKIRELET